MPTLVALHVDDVFQRCEFAGQSYDDTYMLEKLKNSFNGIHQGILASMDLNIKFIDTVINEMEMAIEDFENHSVLFQDLEDSVQEHFEAFHSSYANAETQVCDRINKFYDAVFPSATYEYGHYINDCDKGKVNHVIVTHLYRQYLFDSGDSLVLEADEGYGDLRGGKMSNLKAQFKNLQEIINAVINRELEVPVKWIVDNKERLGEIKASELEFKVHALKYLDIVQNLGYETSNKDELISYARAHLTPLSDHNMSEFKMLMGCMIYSVDEIRANVNSPYSQFFNKSYETKVIAEIERQFHQLIGQCSKDPLSSVVSVGAKVLSGVFRAARIVEEEKSCGWAYWGAIPLWVDLEEEFKIHSQFICPLNGGVMTTSLNPPMALKCGHVFSLQSIVYRANRRYNWKMTCPFCLTISSYPDYITVHF